AGATGAEATAQPDAKPIADGTPSPTEGEGAPSPTAGASGEEGGTPIAEENAEAQSEETTSEGLKTESLETLASARPDPPRSLQEIIKSGYIRVLTRNNDTSFFIYRGHRMGFDYELGKRLAQRMGIRVDMVITSDWNEMVPALLRGEGDAIAA